MTYDTAGNLITDTYTGAGTCEYDAENKMTRAWGGNNQWQEYTYNADGQRTRRKVDGQETWQIYGMDGELLAEYAANGSLSSPQKEYGYRNGQLLITAEASATIQNVTWQNAVGVSSVGNGLTKTASTGWANSGASSTQTIASGDGYVEFTVSETNTDRMLGLSTVDSDQNYASVGFAILLADSGTVYIFESGVSRGGFGTYVTGDKLRVAVEGGVVKYRKNGTLIYTSQLTPGYPLLVDTALHTNGSTLSNVVISGASGGAGGSSAVSVGWLVADHLGTPRMIVDQTGTLANIKRHDYLPFGEELLAPIGGRGSSLGYTVGDGVRQQFTLKERDLETGLDFFEARYYANVQGRFTSPDPLFFQKEMMLDPQRFNLYAYVRNNPLKLVDPKGLAIELTGDEAERKRKLDLIRQAVGKEAGAYLYENKAKDGKYYVGIYNNGPDGKSKPFEQVNSVAGDFAKVINDTYVAQVQLVPQGTLVQVEGGMARIGTVDRITGATPGASYVDQYGRATIYLLDPGTDPGKLPPVLMSDGNAQQLILSDVLAHETAHVEARWGHVIGPSNTNAVDLENRARKLRDPNAPIRTGHDSPNDALGPQPLIINVRPGTERNWKP